MDGRHAHHDEAATANCVYSAVLTSRTNLFALREKLTKFLVPEHILT